MQTSLKLRSGHKLDLDEYGWNGQSCFWFEMDHQFERVPDFKTIFDYYIVKNHWSTWIKPGMTCIDIGGHSGDTAIPMMTQCRSTVLSVEPNPTVLPYLKFNCSVNEHLGRFVIASEAVTNQNADGLTFKDHQNGMCNGGLVGEKWDAETTRRVAGMSGESITVTGMTLETMLDKYLTKKEIENIGFIKTDTEGHDIEIIRNIRDILVKYKPILFTEWFAQYSASDTEKLFRVIDDAGYVAHYPETMQPADPSIRSDDLVCIHKDNL
ncbi:fkbM_fam, methyltransferase, FkbM family [uncultured Caudovirales phage]|uniref:FkbM_fam, methyltransferase, FkbM family n=1 Tax=uncultured Caudovirales phage TaxID=2100421 RepID=A0A6J5LG87_9CAUD|nr:fkbM_fam, methyltransferase, FkbM family [uncultured Caudovirales phage]